MAAPDNVPDVQSLHQRISALESTLHLHHISALKDREAARVPHSLHTLAAAAHNPTRGIGRDRTLHVHLDDATHLWTDALLPFTLSDCALVPIAQAPATGLMGGLPDPALFAPVNVEALLQRLPPTEQRAQLITATARVLSVHSGLDIRHICTHAMALGSSGGPSAASAAAFLHVPAVPQTTAELSLPAFALSAAVFALGAAAAQVGDSRQLIVLSRHALIVHELTAPGLDTSIDHIIALVVHVHFRILFGDGPSPTVTSTEPSMDVGTQESIHPAVYDNLLKAIALARRAGLHLDVPDTTGTQYPTGLDLAAYYEALGLSGHDPHGRLSNLGGGLSVEDSVLRRGVWWELVWLDALIADALGHPPSIQDNTFDVALPACPSVEPPAEGEPVAQTAPVVDSRAAFVHWRCRLVQLLKRLQARAITQALAKAASHDSDISTQPGAVDDRMDLTSDLVPSQPFAPVSGPSRPPVSAPPLHATNHAELGVLRGVVSPPLSLEAARQAAGEARQFILSLQGGFPTGSTDTVSSGVLSAVVQHVVLGFYTPFLRKYQPHIPPEVNFEVTEAAARTIDGLQHINDVVHEKDRVTYPGMPLGYLFARMSFHAGVAAGTVVLRDPSGLLSRPALAVLTQAEDLIRCPRVTGAPSQGQATSSATTLSAVTPRLSPAARVLSLLRPRDDRKQGRSVGLASNGASTGRTLVAMEGDELDLDGLALPYIGPRVGASLLRGPEDKLDTAIAGLQMQQASSSHNIPNTASSIPQFVAPQAVHREPRQETPRRRDKEKEKDGSGRTKEPRDGTRKRAQVGVRPRLAAIAPAPHAAASTVAEASSPISAESRRVSIGSPSGTSMVVKPEPDTEAADITASAAGRHRSQRRRCDSTSSSFSASHQASSIDLQPAVALRHPQSPVSQIDEDAPMLISHPQPSPSLHQSPSHPHRHSRPSSLHHAPQTPPLPSLATSVRAAQQMSPPHHQPLFHPAPGYSHSPHATMYSGHSTTQTQQAYSEQPFAFQPVLPTHSFSQAAGLGTPLSSQPHGTPPIQYHPATTHQPHPQLQPQQYHPPQFAPSEARGDDRSFIRLDESTHGQATSADQPHAGTYQHPYHHVQQPPRHHGSTFLAHAQGEQTPYDVVGTSGHATLPATSAGHAQMSNGLDDITLTEASMSVNATHPHGSDLDGGAMDTDASSTSTSTRDREVSVSSSDGPTLIPGTTWASHPTEDQPAFSSFSVWMPR